MWMWMWCEYEYDMYWYVMLSKKFLEYDMTWQYMAYDLIPKRHDMGSSENPPIYGIYYRNVIFKWPCIVLWNNDFMNMS